MPSGTCPAETQGSFPLPVRSCDVRPKLPSSAALGGDKLPGNLSYATHKGRPLRASAVIDSWRSRPVRYLHQRQKSPEFNHHLIP